MFSVMALLCVDANALNIAIVPKSSSDANQITVSRGCNLLAQSEGDRCDLIQVSGDFQPRMQVHAINALIKLGAYDAIAVSVTDSDMLGPVLEKLSIPVITFDSDFSEKYQGIRESYVGVDDYQIGVELAKQAQATFPEGGTVCLMSALYNENLDRRMEGVRHTLAQVSSDVPVYRLVGQQNWFESTRCPWNSGDDVTRALQQLEITLNSVKPDILISVGDWAIRYADKYHKTVVPFKHKVTSGKTRVFSANGEFTESHAQLIEQSLLHGIVYIDFELMGKQVYKTIRILLENGEVEDTIDVGHSSRTAEIPLQ